MPTTREADYPWSTSSEGSTLRDSASLRTVEKRDSTLFFSILPSPLISSACEDSKQRLRIYPEGLSQLADGTEVGFHLVALDTDNGVNSHTGFFG